MSVADLDLVIYPYHQANSAFASGNPEPLQRLFSHRDDVTLLDPTGAIQRGWDAVSKRQARNAAVFHEGEQTAYERIATHVTSYLAVIVEVERHRAKIGESGQPTASTLRVTTVFRPEDGTWKVVHRQADPIMAPRPLESVFQQ